MGRGSWTSGTSCFGPALPAPSAALRGLWWAVNPRQSLGHLENSKHEQTAPVLFRDHGKEEKAHGFCAHARSFPVIVVCGFLDPQRRVPWIWKVRLKKETSALGHHTLPASVTTRAGTAMLDMASPATVRPQLLPVSSQAAWHTRELGCTGAHWSLLLWAVCSHWSSPGFVFL